MLKLAELKKWLHQDFAAEDKLLLLLTSFDAPCQIKDVRDQATEAGFRVPKSWNPSALLARTKGKAIRTPQGWEITEAGRERLHEIGVFSVSPAVQHVSSELRKHAANISDTDVREFVDEAVKCHELQLFRSAVVMSWLGAMAVLHNEVVKNHLAAFNAEAKRRNPKWKTATTADDLGRMKERDFLDALQSISVIGQNVKNALIQCLDRRNSCGHPNSYRLSENTVAAHIETLILNVFSKF